MADKVAAANHGRTPESVRRQNEFLVAKHLQIRAFVRARQDILKMGLSIDSAPVIFAELLEMIDAGDSDAI